MRYLLPDSHATVGTVGNLHRDAAQCWNTINNLCCYYRFKVRECFWSFHYRRAWAPTLPPPSVVMLAEQESHLILAIWSIFTFPMMLLAPYLITLFWLGLWQAEIISHRLLKELLSEENTLNQETTSLGGPLKETRARGKTTQKVSSGTLKGFMLRSQKAATVSFQKQFLIITVHFKDCTDSVVLLNVAGRVLNVQYEKGVKMHKSGQQLVLLIRAGE